MRIRWFVLFVLCLGHSWSNAQKEQLPEIRSKVNEVGHPFIRNYSAKEYNAFNQNKAVVADSLGILYFANGDGVLTYDGDDWKLLPLPNNGNVFIVNKDDKGRIYAGGIGEFGYLQPDSIGRLEYVSFLPQLPNEHLDFGSIRRICPVGDTVYFSSYKNTIYKWNGSSIEALTFSTEAQLVPHSVGNNLFVHELGSGLKKLMGENLVMVPDGDFLSENAIYEMIPLNRSELLVVASNGVFTYNGKKFQPFVFKNHTFPKELGFGTCIKLNENTIAFGTKYHGIVFSDVDGNVLKHIQGEQSLLSDVVHGLYVDKSGILWAGLLKGIVKIEYPSPFSLFDAQNNLGRFVFKVIRHNGKLFAATATGVYTLKASESIGESSFEPLPGFSNFTYELIECQGSLLIDAPWSVVHWNADSSHKIKLYGANSMVQSKVDTNRVFVGHFKGLSTLYKTNGVWSKEKDFSEIKTAIDKVLEDDQGDVWLKTNENYVLRLSFENVDFARALKSPKLESFGTDSGLPDDLQYIRKVGEDIYSVPNNGTYKFDRGNEQFIQDSIDLSKRFGLEERPILIKGQDQHGNLLIRVAGNESEQYLAWNQTDGSYDVKEINAYRIADLVRQDPFLEVHDSILWHLSEDAGLIRHDLKASTKIKKPKPDVVISSIYYKGDSLLYGGWGMSGIKELPYKNNQLRFQFSSPGFFEEDKNQYQFYLEGFEEEWSDWTLETQKDYTNIPEGNYNFKVRAKNIFGEISEEQKYAMTIVPPWYRTWMAYFGYLLVLLASFWWFSKWRSRQLHAKNLALEEIIKKRTDEIRTKNQKLLEQTEKLKELDVAKTRFFANISHEFRTPLTLIKGPIDQVAQSGKNILDHKNLEIVQNNTDRLLKLVNQLLDLSKLDSGKFTLNRTEGDCSKLLKAVGSSFSSLAAQRDIDFVIDVSPKQSWSSFDRDKLELIAYNLLGNAFKFTPDGGQILFKCTQSENQLTLKVKDTGIGISKEELNLIFDRFYQTDDSYTKENPGSGIGLALVKELVDFMGGTINVNSTLGKGTEFQVTLPVESIKTNLPLKDEPSNLTFSPEVVKEVSHDSLESEKEHTVLVIDDNEEMRFFIKEALKTNYAIVEAKNGKSGLATAIRIIPDVIVTDLMMPKMDGLTLVQKLRSQLQTSHIPIVMLTAKAGMENKLEGLEIGADEYLTKPFNVKELNVRIRNLIASREKLRELLTNKSDIEPEKIEVTSIDKRFMEQLKLLLEEKYAESTFGVPEMQKELGMGKTQLYRKLKAVTGNSPSELLRNFRLKRAAFLLANHSDNVSQIAYSVGFNSLSYFTRRFKEYYGVLPSDYTKDNK